MKRINFINPLSPSQAYELRRWVLITASLFASALLGILIVTGTQWNTHRCITAQCGALQSELSQFTAGMERQHSSKSEYETLQKKVDKLTRCANCPKNPLDVVTTIRTASGTAPIQSMSVTKKKIEVQTVCTNAKQATGIVKKLAASPLLQNVQLVSLHATANQQLVATISAARVKKVA